MGENLENQEPKYTLQADAVAQLVECLPETQRAQVRFPGPHQVGWYPPVISALERWRREDPEGCWVVFCGVFFFFFQRQDFSV